MNVEALNQMVRVLENVASNQILRATFDLESWSNEMWSESTIKILTAPIPVAEQMFECGTTACACGHAGLDPWFNQRGFKWDVLKSFGRTAHLSCFDKNGNQLIGWHAVQEFFELGERQAEHLFSQEAYNEEGIYQVTPEDVIARIRILLGPNTEHSLTTG